jgi:antitoxin (DNA-binding transcriptional repressor) of toxin-antitoxin stability system
MSTTQLRTNYAEFLRLLEQGETISLIHRSKVVANVTPKTKRAKKKKFDVKKFAGGIHLSDSFAKPLTPEYINEILETRYDNVLSRHK